jgi:transposase
VRQAIQEHLDFIEQQLQQLEQQLQELLRGDEQSRQQMQLLVSIPAIGARTAAKFLAEVPDVHCFAQVGQLDAYAGLIPKVHESGQSVRRSGGLDKSGNPDLPTAFSMPALAAHRYHPIIADLVKRLKAKGKSKMTILVAVMRKLLPLAYGVLKTGKPFDPLHALPSTS